jgi:hypothetical protein
LDTLSREGGFAIVPRDGIFDGRGRSVMEERPAEAQSPQSRCPDLVRLRNALTNSVAGADVVKQKVRKERDRTPVEQRVRTRPCHERWNVTSRASDGVKYHFTSAH